MSIGALICFSLGILLAAANFACAAANLYQHKEWEACINFAVGYITWRSTFKKAAKKPNDEPPASPQL